MDRLNSRTWHTDLVQVISNKFVHSKAQSCFHYYYFMNNLQQFVIGPDKKKKKLL